MRFIPVFILFLAFFNACTPKTFEEKLAALPGVIEVNKIEIDTSFTAQYELFFEQYLDHKQPSKGVFRQRVVLSHLDFEKPMVAVLEGYNIWSGRASEPTKLLQSNQLNIEHRFFADSRPETIDWSNLSIYNAATDQHNIIKALQKLYKGNWLSTGVSKGGQTTMYHKFYYPKDVQASIAYVAPLNFSREDPRIYEFLASVGTPEERERIYNFQRLCFEHENELIPMLEQKAKEKKWTFNFGLKNALRYSILEYSFAFWQWGGISAMEIPTKADYTVKELFAHLNRVSGFTFFEDKSVENMHAFFYAALTQMGIYGYQTEPFKEYLGDTADYTFDFSAPKGSNPVYDDKIMAQVKAFLDAKGDNMLFVVGGKDTWGATAYVPEGNSNAVNMTLPEGHHGTRIKHFNDADKKYMYSLLEEWMELNYKIEMQ